MPLARPKAIAVAIAFLSVLGTLALPGAPADHTTPSGVPVAANLDRIGTCPSGIEAGAGARTITPVGPDGRIWQEPFEDRNANGRYDAPDPLDPTAPFDAFTDENANGKWDGPFMAGYGHDESYYTARGVHDDVWARAIVLRCGAVLLAMVSLDVVGFFIEEVDLVRQSLADLNFTYVLVASTHTHDSVDTMGLWGPNLLTDGKDPRTQEHVRFRAEAAVRDAYGRLAPVTMRLGWTNAPIDFGYLQTDLRDPFVIDDVILTAQFERKDGSGTEATMINWSPHPETMAGSDDLISSDFPHTLRGCVEGTATSVPCAVRGRRYPGLGGTAVYFSGAVGGMMTTLRTRVFDETGARIPDYTYEKHERIGEITAAAAMDSLRDSPAEDVTALRVQMREVYVPGDNPFLIALNSAGVFDHPVYAGPGVRSPALGPTGVVAPFPYLRSQVSLVSIGAGPRPAAQIATVPGELLPEIAIGGFLQATDECYRFNAAKQAVTGGDGRERVAAANPQVPPEPVLREHMTGRYKFLFGLANDELGYIVPANDFTPATLYPVYEFGTDRCGDTDHYEETNSASSKLAPAVAQTLAAMADPRYVPPPDPAAHAGFLDWDGRATATPSPATTRGVWADTNLNGAYEEHEDARVAIGALPPKPPAAFGFVDSRGRDLGADPTGLEGEDPRGVWVDTSGDGRFTPGLDAVLFIDVPQLGDEAVGNT